MAASLRLCVVLGFLASPLFAEQNQKSQSFNYNEIPQFRQNPQFQPIPQTQNSVYDHKVEEPKPSGFKTMLFRILGIGKSPKPGQAPSFQTMPPNFFQGGPCGIPFSTTTTTPSPYGPCPFPPGPYQPHPQQPGFPPISPGPNPPYPQQPGFPTPSPHLPNPTTSGYGPDVTHNPGGGGSSAQVTADPFDRPPPTQRPVLPFPDPLTPVPQPSQVPPVPHFPVPEPSRIPPVAPYPVTDPSRVPPVGPYPVDPFKVPPVGPFNPFPDPSRVPPVGPYQPFPDPARVPPVAPYPVIDPLNVPPVGPFNPFPDPSRVPPVGPYQPGRVPPVDPYPDGKPTGLPPPPGRPGLPPPPPTATPKPTRPPPPVGPSPIRPDMNEVYGRRLPCSTLRAFVPSGFSYASLGNYAATQCDLIHPLSVNGVLRNEPPCSVLESLRRLGANKFRELVIASGMDIVLTRLDNYTLFVPLDVSFKRLPTWLSSSLETDAKLQQAFVLNHFVKHDLPLTPMRNEQLIPNERPGGHRIRVNVYFDQLESAIYSVDGARIVRGDILVANGRIHLTDKVIMPNPSRNAAEYLSEKEAFEAFWNIVKNTNLDVFQSKQPITLFIPLNSAMAKIDVASLMAEPDKLSRFVGYHVVNGTYYSSGMINNEYLTTNYDEKEIKIGIGSDSYSKYLTQINGRIRVVKSDIPLMNGVAHVVEDCFSDQKSFYMFEEGDEFEFEYGVISKRSMKITGEEKFLDF